MGRPKRLYPLGKYRLRTPKEVDKDKAYPVELEYTWNRQIIRKTTNVFVKVTDWNQKGKTKVQNGNSSVSGKQTADNEETVVLIGMLHTELAIKVFAKAIEAGYMSEKGSHYKWNDSKVLLAYMCGRIYCGDRPEYSETDEKSYWKFGRMGVFPDTELSNLFEMPDLVQSRSNRKDLAVPVKSKEIDKFFE